MTSPQPGVPSSDKLRQRVHNALKALRRPATGEQPLGHLRLFQAAGAGNADEQMAAASVLARALEELKHQYPEATVLLSARYVEDRTAVDVANWLGVSDAELYRRQQRAIDLLTALIQRKEDALCAQARAQALGRLEAPTYAELVGVEAHLQALEATLTTGTPPHLLCITGLGGIGKTAMADALMRRLIDGGQIWTLAWLTARQRTLRLDGSIGEVHQPALSSATLVEALWSQLLPEVPLPLHGESEAVLGEMEFRFRRLKQAFAVIDNLETVADLADLIPMLRRLANPVKFVLTTRTSLLGEGYVYHYQLGELSRADAVELLRREARLRNIPALIGASDEKLRRIVDLVGGHPLALRLVVGRTLAQTLEAVLVEVKQAEGKSIENLYTHIYWHAWQGLNEVERNTLLAMAQVAPTGGDVGLIEAITTLPASQLHDALARLVELNLVDWRNDQEAGRYSIHSLTRTFLLKQVLDWQ